MKHSRTKATDIPKYVRIEVGIRDNGNCIICGQVGIPNAHFIPRSQGGLGIKENIVTLCFKCHHEFDNGSHRIDYEKIIEKYLKSKYEAWDKNKLIYNKWMH